jgi:hypothetical protein
MQGFASGVAVGELARGWVGRERRVAVGIEMGAGGSNVIGVGRGVGVGEVARGSVGTER